MLRELYRWIKELPLLVKAVARDLAGSPEDYQSCDGFDDGLPRFGTTWYPAQGCRLSPRMYLTTPFYLQK